MQPLSTVALISIYLVIFIDNLGASLIIPMLTPIAQDPDIGLVATGSPEFRHAVYGITLGIYSIAMFFGAPILGALSDTLGRKKTLLLCLFGLACSYGLLALALVFKNLGLFVFGRLIGGLFSGSVPVAQAAIITVTSEKNRAQYIGYIMFFVAFGYIVGPLIGGYLSDATLVPWFELKTPFIFVATLSVLNLLILLLAFQETTHPQSTQTALKIMQPIAHLRTAFRIPAIKKDLTVLMLMLLGWNTFFQFIGLYLTQSLLFNAAQISTLISWVGIGLAAAFLFLVGWLTQRLKTPRMITNALALMMLCISTTLITQEAYLLYGLAALGAIGFGLAYSGLIAQMSCTVDPSHQGSLMGMAAATAALSAGLSAFIAAWLANLDAAAPIMIACVLVLLATIISIRARQTVHQTGNVKNAGEVEQAEKKQESDAAAFITDNLKASKQ